MLTTEFGRTCLLIDMAYSFDEVGRRGHFQFFEARHSGDYFDKVIGLHPLADLVTNLEAPVERKRFSDRQDIIEAKSGAVGLPRWLAPANVFLTQRRLLDHVTHVVRREKVDLIGATDPLYSGLFGLWLKRRTGLPFVLHLVANFDLNYEATKSLAMPHLFPSRAIEKHVIRHVLRNADLIAAGSETLREYAIRHGAPSDRTEIFPVAKNIVPEHRVPPEQRRSITAAEREHLGIAGARRLLLTVARLEPVKMVDHSILAFSVVAREHRDAFLLLAGEGSERPRLQALASELGVAERVRFVGLLNQDLLSRIAPLCLTLSPLTGMALFETSMAGSPAVAYDCDSAVRDMVVNGVTGAVVKAKDWEEMGYWASRILGDPSTYERMSTAIRQRAQQLTDEKSLYAHEHSVFDRLLGTGTMVNTADGQSDDL